MFADPAIAGDFTQLADRLNTAHALTRWSHAEPALRDIASVEELAALLHRDADTDRDRVDQLLGAIVRTASRHGGDDLDATLLALHLLADGVRVIAARLADLSDDILALLVGELTAQIRCFPRRRTRAYAANLLRDTQQACWRELRPHRTRTYPAGDDIPIDPLDEVATRRWLDQPVAGPGHLEEPDLADLVDLLAWAEHHGLASREDLALLVEFERRRGYGTRARHEVAAAFGINERTLRRRRQRTLSALREAATHWVHGDVLRDHDASHPASSCENPGWPVAS